MRYSQYTNQITEAPMNPSSFAKAIQTGHDKGVQVGFEFEVCIPKMSVERWKNGDVADPGRYDPNSLTWIEGKTIKDLLEGFDKWGRKTWRDNLEDLFKHKASVGREVGTNNVWASYQNWVDKKITDFKSTMKSKVISGLTELMKNPKLNDVFEMNNGEGITRITFKNLLIQYLNRDTGLDFNGKISARELSAKIPEIKKTLEQLYYRTSGPYDHLFYRVANSDENQVNEFKKNFFISHTSDADELERNREQCIESMTAWATEVYGTDNLKELLTTKWAFKARVNNNTDTLKEKLWFFVTPSAEPPRSMQSRYNRGNSYQDGADFLKSNLKDSFGGNMTIFTGYHQDTKKLDRWYIEPDGSLRPSGPEDYSAEVVSPPLQAKTAMTALHTFYAKAADMKLYTNSSTGLHINVSIPDTLDVLKLAMFVGDQHVLKTFGREDNGYARSIIKTLTGAAEHNADNYAASQPRDIEADLKRIATRQSGDHFATVNFNGKYVSFRHAGGDYLSRYEEIKNTVGRFIHAMIIASDPQMYRAEYLKKLTALVGSTQPKAENPVDLRTGIPALIADFIMFPNNEGNTDVARDSINIWLRNEVQAEFYLVPAQGSAERLNTVNGMAASTRTIIQNGGDAGCVRAVIFPTSKNQLEFIQGFIRRNNDTTSPPFGVYEGGKTYRGGTTKVAVGAFTPYKMTSKDKGFATAYRGLAAGGKPGRLPLPESKK
jgi:hypothetical protein